PAPLHRAEPGGRGPAGGRGPGAALPVPEPGRPARVGPRVLRGLPGRDERRGDGRGRHGGPGPPRPPPRPPRGAPPHRTPHAAPQRERHAAAPRPAAGPERATWIPAERAAGRTRRRLVALAALVLLAVVAAVVLFLVYGRRPGPTLPEGLAVADPPGKGESIP